jgi:hypothetical protein
MYHLERNPTILFCGKRIQSQADPSPSPNFPHDTRIKVTLVEWPLLTPPAQKQVRTRCIQEQNV